MAHRGLCLNVLRNSLKNIGCGNEMRFVFLGKLGGSERMQTQPWKQSQNWHLLSAFASNQFAVIILALLLLPVYHLTRT